MATRRENASSVREAVIEAYFRAQVVKEGGEPEKIADKRGWPDRMVLWVGGVVHWVELKRPKGGKFEPLQERTHGKLRKRGFQVFVISTKEQVDRYISLCKALGLTRNGKRLSQYFARVAPRGSESGAAIAGCSVAQEHSVSDRVVEGSKRTRQRRSVLGLVDDA